ncbi:MAG: aminoacyl-tRNA hydrolase, partial [Pseudomonadota bacterium]
SKAECADYYDDTLDRMARSVSHLFSFDDVGAGRFMSGVAQPGAAAAPEKKPDPKPAPPAPQKPKQEKKPSSPFDILKGLGKK